MQDVQQKPSLHLIEALVNRGSDWPTSKPQQAKGVLLARIRQLEETGDLESALAIAEALNEALGAGSRDPEIDAAVGRCRTALQAKYAARLGPLSGVPVLRVPSDRWLELDLDARTCFVLAHLDSISNVETIVDVSGLPAHEALRILCVLLERGVIAIR